MPSPRLPKAANILQRTLLALPSIKERALQTGDTTEQDRAEAIIDRVSPLIEQDMAEYQFRGDPTRMTPEQIEQEDARIRDYRLQQFKTLPKFDVLQNKTIHTQPLGSTGGVPGGFGFAPPSNLAPLAQQAGEAQEFNPAQAQLQDVQAGQPVPQPAIPVSPTGPIFSPFQTAGNLRDAVTRSRQALAQLTTPQFGPLLSSELVERGSTSDIQETLNRLKEAAQLQGTPATEGMINAQNLLDNIVRDETALAAAAPTETRAKLFGLPTQQPPTGPPVIQPPPGPTPPPPPKPPPDVEGLKAYVQTPTFKQEYLQRLADLGLDKDPNVLGSAEAVIGTILNALAFGPAKVFGQVQQAQQQREGQRLAVGTGLMQERRQDTLLAAKQKNIEVIQQLETLKTMLQFAKFNTAQQSGDARNRIRLLEARSRSLTEALQGGADPASITPNLNAVQTEMIELQRTLQGAQEDSFTNDLRRSITGTTKPPGKP